MATKKKNIWILIIFILSGLVVGGLYRAYVKKYAFKSMSKI